jgi:uncharacterized membrane protein
VSSPSSGVFRRWYPVLLALVGAAASVAVYRRLPETMAVHWDMDGNPNGWMPRAFGASFGPVFLLVLWQIMRVLPRLDPREPNYARFGDAYDTIVAAVLLLLLATHCIVLAVALGYQVAVSRLVPALVGVLFVVIGNVMPRMRPNWWFGVRTPWTLSNDRVWARTHRLAGFSMTAAGIVIVASTLVLPARLGLPVLIAAIVAATIGPVVYSYLTWKREQRR